MQLAHAADAREISLGLTTDKREDSDIAEDGADELLLLLLPLVRLFDAK